MIDTAIILAGGLGTRLAPLTNETPKPLLPMKGKPIMQHSIEQLQRFGIQRVILSIGYKEQKVRDHFTDNPVEGVKIEYSIEHVPLGTGGAVKQAAQGLEKPFFLVWGDNLMDIDYRGMENIFAHNDAQITMALTSRDDVENFGVAKLEGSKIINFIEKPKKEEAPSKLINAGAFIVDPACLQLLPEGKSSLEKDCFEKLAPRGKISAFIHKGQWFPTDTLEKYNHANRFFYPEFDIKRKKIIIADVDDTICDSCKDISAEMAEQIARMIRIGYEFAFISGTKHEDLFAMISSRLKEKHHLLATTGTHYTVVERDSVNVVYNNPFAQEEKKEITSAFKKLIASYNIQSLTTEEDQLQDRESQITLSAIGRHAPSDLKAAYDPAGIKREGWINFLKKHFDGDKYDIKIGGTTSIDITRKGLDKEWGIRRFLEYNNLNPKQVIFFGDKIYPGGNDYPASKVVDCISVNGPSYTLKELKKIYLLNNILTDERPWGNFEQYTSNQQSTVKILSIEPGRRLSLQSHQDRDELWIALDDGVVAEIDNKEKTLNSGEKILVPKGTKHRLSSTGKKARVLEISLGKFDEKDIIRYEDDFGRA